MQGEEACDDGNASNADACTTSCRPTRCGDGFAQGDEACDDGNLDNTDGCTNVCALPRCGDGFTQTGRQEACDDGNRSDSDACRNDCQLSLCVPTPEGMNDNNVCTTDSCDLYSGVVHVPLSQVSCDDGLLCNGVAVCREGRCIQGAPVAINDSNPCTADSCSEQTGAVNTPVTAATCGDGNRCTQCQAGRCVATPVPQSENVCVAWSCDPQQGVVMNALSGVRCGGDVCTGLGTCNQGQCVVAAPAVVDDDENDCTVDACDAATGGTSHTQREGSCNTGNICIPGTCVRGQCVQGRPVAGEDDGNPCTDDRCDPERGMQVHNPISLPREVRCSPGRCMAETAYCLSGQCKVIFPPSRGMSNCTAVICDPTTGQSTQQESPIIGLGCKTNGCSPNSTACNPGATLCGVNESCPSTYQCDDGALRCVSPQFTRITGVIVHDNVFLNQ